MRATVFPAFLFCGLIAACAPMRDKMRDNALYVVDGVRMEITRDRTIVDTSKMARPATAEVPDAVILGPGAVSRGMMIRRADGGLVDESDRRRAEAAFGLYCAARGAGAPKGLLIPDRVDRPTGFLGFCEGA